ncbi:MAG: RagB/SusD family nutrient uptake outer membrane protein [Bacteroidales bacterium]|jgi:hypothetical protein|nr:RagB/SusD family nutrient uptake outer membrane protein [Bacteroidales bacterium]
MNRILKVLLTISIVLTYSCSKDYLNTKPTGSTTTTTVFETVENIALAINGINRLMCIQYLGTQGMNGEGTIKMWYGNYPGNHFFVNLPGWASIINGEFREVTTSIYLYYPWYYYYRIIGNANSIIVNTDAARGAQTDKDFVKAQALTFRAYAYFMLSQIYCNRWKDSNNGAADGLVLRLDESTGDMALSTLGEVYTQVYKDLDEAIALYTSSGKSRQFNYDPDKSVAYAIYARAAITKQDYAKAATMATNARNGYSLMSNSDYRSGFNAPNSEWIWGSFGSTDENLHFFSFHAYIGYNSNASNVRLYPKCISKELFDRVPSSDIRKSLFLNPEGYSYTTATGVAGAALRAKAFQLYPDIFSTSTAYAYMQFKFKSLDFPGVGHVNHFRSSEMILIEAEAKYFQNDYPGAQTALNTLNRDSGRDPGYSCTKTGTALLEEIKMYRALELWGEGFDWFDLKRWGDNLKRKSPADGGSFISVLAVERDPSYGNNWTWRIPLRETDYNNLLN